MSSKVAPKADTKNALLQVGMELMMEKGYTNTGINDVLHALAVPKGSFYHYFESKENFAVEIIRHFDRGYCKTLTQTLQNEKQSPLQRLRTFCDISRAMLVAQQCRKGCLIGNLSQEMADQSEVLRIELCIVINKWREIIARCIEEGQQCKEIEGSRSARELAELFSAGWSGALMRAKTVKNTEPLDTFMDLMFTDILKA